MNLHALSRRRGLAHAALAAGSLAFLSAAAAAQLPSIFPVPIIPTGSSGYGALGVDLNLDGRVDIVTGGESLQVNLGLAAGGFAPAVVVPAGTYTYDLAAADVDGNGYPDVVGSGGTVKPKFVLALGQGDGTLQDGTVYFVGGQLTGIGAGDVTGDGLVDVVTSSQGPTFALQVNAANGTGGFLGTVSHPLPILPYYLALVDFDGDGSLDAAFTTSGATDSASVCFGDGVGGFGAPVTRALPDNPGRPVVYDADVDGDLDLVIPCASVGPGGFVAFVYGDGAGGLSLALSLPVTPAPGQLDLGDLDGDGLPEIAFRATQKADTAFVLPSIGGGGYLPPLEHKSTSNLLRLMLAEASADGLTDVLAFTGGADGMAVMTGDGAGGLQSCERYELTQPSAVAIADVSGDGHADLLAAAGTPQLATLRGDGAGGFLPALLASFPPYPQSKGEARHLAVGDVTGDGWPDVLANTDNVLLQFTNDGAGTLLGGAIVPGSLDGLDVDLGDLDGDGNLDAVEPHLVNPTGPPYPGVLLRYLGQGALGLQAPVAFDAGSDPNAAALGDLNDDGHLDAAVVNQFGLGMSVLPGDGLGGFGAPIESAYQTSQVDIALGDLDLDGHLDAATKDLHDDVTTLRGHGDGTLEVIGVAPGSGWLDGTRLGIADVDGDGYPDVLRTAYIQGTVQVLLNDGRGALLPEQSYAAGTYPEPLAVGDVDGDHRPDALAGARLLSAGSLGELAVLRNLADFRWTDLGFALPGALGAPQLAGTGSLVPGSPGDLRLFHARPASIAVLFVSGAPSPVPFKGGTLVPVPPMLQLALVTSAAGSITVPWSAWPSAAPGQDWYFQYAIADPAAVHGVALSNALQSVEPTP